MWESPVHFCERACDSLHCDAGAQLVFINAVLCHAVFMRTQRDGTNIDLWDIFVRCVEHVDGMYPRVSVAHVPLQAPHGGWVRHTQQGTITAQWRRLSLERCGVGCPCCHFLSRGTCATPPSPLRTLSPTHSPSLSRSHPLSHAPPHPLSLSSTLTHIQHAVYRCAHVVAFFQTTNQRVC